MFGIFLSRKEKACLVAELALCRYLGSFLETETALSCSQINRVLVRLPCLGTYPSNFSTIDKQFYIHCPELENWGQGDVV